MKIKSIKKNIFLNTVKVCMLALFPLITFPYATRILGIDNIGKVQFATSIVSFFLLFASLGINSYAIREASPIREDRCKISKFSSEIFSINIITTILSYIVLFIIILISKKINLYSGLILILSTQIIFTTIGLDWIYTVYEDFFYIAIRSILIQIISLFLMFLFVKNESDYYKYTIITVIANSGIYILNFFHLKKYIDLRFCFKMNLKKHIKPLLILFSNEITQQIYINSDMIMLGLMTSDYFTGIYAVSVKIYILVKRLLNSAIAVIIPRLAFYSVNEKNKFNELSSNIFNISMMFLMPAVLLLFLLSDNLIILISGEEYLAGGITLKILSFGLLVSVFANLFCNGILIVKKQEKYVFKGSLMAAIANVLLNIVFIKIFKQNGAAVTTVISELIITVYTFMKSREYLKINKFFRNFIIDFIGCFGIYIIYLFVNTLYINSNIIFILVVGISSTVVYLLIEFILNNKFVLEIINDKF